MNILHFATHDVAGGAAKASYNLHVALRRAGSRSRMVVRHKVSTDPDVARARLAPRRLWASGLERLRRRLARPRRRSSRRGFFNFDHEPPLDPRSLLADVPSDVDVICLHWITGLLSTRGIRRLHEHYGRPIVWTPADQEPVTGGCHYSLGCRGFTAECGACPQLGSADMHDHTHVVWRRKQEHLAPLPICFVAPTSWVAARIRESRLFGDHRVEQIPYAIDTAVFRPASPAVARDLLRLPRDRRILFFGATDLDDPRKGVRYAVEALHHLAAALDRGNGLRRTDVFVLVAGRRGRRLVDSLPFPRTYLGYLRDDRTLASAYQAADVFLCPSLEDAGPLMISEAMLCATPVVAFDAGGAPDLIRHRQSGYLAAGGDPLDLARGVHDLLSRSSLAPVREAAHRTAERLHAPDLVAKRHLALYESLRAPGSS